VKPLQYIDDVLLLSNPVLATNYQKIYVRETEVAIKKGDPKAQVTIGYKNTKQNTMTTHKAIKMSNTDPNKKNWG
jgi:hypothetical protein